MDELHNDICGMKAQILRAGYFWPTIEVHCKMFLGKCNRCQEHNDDVKAPSFELHNIISPWPFAQCGMDIVSWF